MKSIVVGGGKVGYFLVKTLREHGFQVTAVERDEAACRKIAEELDAEVICGDGTDPDVLRDAGVEKADVLAAVTGADEENLVACQLARVCFSVGRTIARVNNPKNTVLFKALGVDQTVCSTEVIANLVESEFLREDLRILQVFERGNMLLAEIVIRSADHFWAGRKVQEAQLPAECVFASILRGEEVIYPRGASEMAVGDKVLVLASKTALSLLTRLLRMGEDANVSAKK